MRIDKLSLKNFRGFAEAEFNFHPKFNLLVGENASGKTSVLDALSVAAGSWFLGIGGCATRHIKEQEIRRFMIKQGETMTLEEAYPVEVSATGIIDWTKPEPKQETWKRSIENAGGNTRFKEAVSIKKKATEIQVLVRNQQPVALPLIAYYGAGRLWALPKDMEAGASRKKNGLLSRFDGYKTSIDPRISFPNLFRWLREEKYVALEKQSERKTFQVVKAAMKSCLAGCENLDYDVSHQSLLVTLSSGRILPYHLLSDGQRAMLAMVADIAIKAATLNPHFEDRVLEETRGVVLIDELDLHLHPRWQRHVVEDLKRTFPQIQFFASTHSPQVIGETPHEEIILLKNDGTWTRPDASIGLHTNEVLREIMGADIVNAEAAKEFEQIAHLIDEGEFESAQSRIDDYRKRMGNVPELEASEVYMARVEALADDGKEEV